LNASYIAWMVVERGMFNVSHNAYNIQKDWINRTNINDSTDFRNRRTSFTQYGCFGSAIKQCVWDAGFSALQLLSIAQLLTTRYSRFLLLRGSLSAKKNRVTYYLTPHDSTMAANYYIPNPGEDYAFMIFEENVNSDCVEGLAIESYRYNINYFRTRVNYKHTFTQPPGIFGMVNTLLGRDSLGLRSFNILTPRADFITQEDKCFDSETIHINAEQS